MHFLDDSLLPENQDKLVIQVAPYGPEWLPGDSDDIPVTMDEQVQKAVDCRNAGAQLLHIHVRELDGRGSKRLSMFNEMIARLRQAVPDMILQVGGSISFAPEKAGDAASWLAYDTRHLLADLDPRPDQVTIAINTVQMNVVEVLAKDDYAGTSFENPLLYKAYRDMVSEAGPEFYLEHLNRLTANGIQPQFMLGNLPQLETVERLIRAGIYTGPLNLNYVALGGGGSAFHPADLVEFARRTPDGAVLTIESIMRSTLPMNTIAVALGLHVRVGIEDNLWAPRKERITSAGQVEQIIRIADELGRDVASAEEAKQIYRLGEYWSSAEETLDYLGLPPNRRHGERGVPLRHRAPQPALALV
jgi:uncharacterized protein (DUF849 family)